VLPREAWAKRVIGRDEGLAFHDKEHNAYFDSDGSKDGELAATTLQLIHDAMVQDDPLHAAQSAHDLRGRRLLLFQSVEPRPARYPATTTGEPSIGSATKRS
jgi:hypothetical protein